MCGPAALSLITGKPVDELTRMLRENRGSPNRRTRIHGVLCIEIREVLRQLGYHMLNDLNAQLQWGKPTLAKALRLLKNRGGQEVYLINTTSHYLVLKGRKLYDNHNPEGVFLRKYERRRKRVQFCWKVVKGR